MITMRFYIIVLNSHLPEYNTQYYTHYVVRIILSVYTFTIYTRNACVSVN